MTHGRDFELADLFEAVITAGLQILVTESPSCVVNDGLPKIFDSSSIPTG